MAIDDNILERKLSCNEISMQIKLVFQLRQTSMTELTGMRKERAIHFTCSTTHLYSKHFVNVKYVDNRTKLLSRASQELLTHTHNRSHLHSDALRDLSYMSVIHMEQSKSALWGVGVDVEETNTNTHIHTPIPTSHHLLLLLILPPRYEAHRNVFF